MSIQVELRRIVEAREVLSFEEAAALMRRVLAGEAADVELAALLGAPRRPRRRNCEGDCRFCGSDARGCDDPSTDFMPSAAKLVDTCGTGGRREWKLQYFDCGGAGGGGGWGEGRQAWEQGRLRRGAGRRGCAGRAGNSNDADAGGCGCGVAGSAGSASCWLRRTTWR